MPAARSTLGDGRASTTKPSKRPGPAAGTRAVRGPAAALRRPRQRALCHDRQIRAADSGQVRQARGGEVGVQRRGQPAGVAVDEVTAAIRRPAGEARHARRNEARTTSATRHGHAPSATASGAPTAVTTAAGSSPGSGAASRPDSRTRCPALRACQPAPPTTSTGRSTNCVLPRAVTRAASTRSTHRADVVGERGREPPEGPALGSAARTGSVTRVPSMVATARSRSQPGHAPASRAAREPAADASTPPATAAVRPTAEADRHQLGPSGGRSRDHVRGSRLRARANAHRTPAAATSTIPATALTGPDAPVPVAHQPAPHATAAAGSRRTSTPGDLSASSVTPGPEAATAPAPSGRCPAPPPARPPW